MGKKDLSTTLRNQVVQFILEACIDGKPKRGRMLEAQQKFNISRQTTTRLWAAAKKQKEKGEAIHLISGKQHRKRHQVLQIDLNLLKSIEYCKRGSIRKLASGLGISKTTVGRWVISGMIRAHTSALKPDLTMPNKLLRMRFSLEALELDMAIKRLTFKNMHNTVHIDEKWFYITKGTHRFYLAPGEEEPHRSCKSKKFISKIMFMCVVCRPLFGINGEVLFDGKIGIFPFTQLVPAKRNSKNRQKGTMEIKPIDSITKADIKECLINKILPAIMLKWPEGASKQIFIQQDNARPHINDHDPEFRAAASKNGFNISLVQQPPNSPDCNVNDLGWFRAIQSLQVQTACKTVGELLSAVVVSFNALEPTTLDSVFLSLQTCLIEIMKVKGQNCYKIPHMGKAALRRTIMLPQNLEVPVDIAINCIKYLIEMGSSEGLNDIIQGLRIDGY